MKLRLKSLRRREPNVYDVELEDERGEARVFTFRHSAGTVDGLIWGDDFAEYMLENVEAARELFDAVFAFHRVKPLTPTREAPRERLFKALISAPGSAHASRATVVASTYQDARNKLEAEHGPGSVWSLHNEEDAKKPR